MCDEMAQENTARDGTGTPEGVADERMRECDTLRAARLYNKLLVELRKIKEHEYLLRSAKEMLRRCSRVLRKSHGWC
jgi:hypothetical protein